MRCMFIVLLIVTLAPTCYSQTSGNLEVEPATRRITLQGYTTAIETSTIAAEVSGRVEQIHYDVGECIAEKPLLGIDTTFVDLDLAEMEIRLQQLHTEQAKARSRLAWLEREHQRQQYLTEEGGLAPSSYDNIKQQRDQARLDVQALQQQQAQLLNQRRRLQQQLVRHTPVAPRNWCVVTRHVNSAEWVTAGTPLFTLGNFQRLQAEFSLDSMHLKALQQALQRGTLQASIDSTPVSCRLYSINPAFDPESRKTRIELEVLNPPLHRGGLLLRLQFSIPEAGFNIPLQALHNRYDHPRVVLADTGTSVAVEIREITDTHAVIAQTPALKAGIGLQRVLQQQDPAERAGQ